MGRERMAKAGFRPGVGPRAQAPDAGTRGLDRPGDDGVALGMRGEREPRRPRRQLPPLREVNLATAPARRLDARAHLDVPPRAHPSPSSPNHARCSATRSSATRYRPGGIGARTARPTWTRPPGSTGPGKRRSEPVPDDRVAERIEPVVRGGHVAPATAPIRRSRPRPLRARAHRPAAPRVTTSASVQPAVPAIGLV